MPQFCAACGAQMADGATTCPACGKAGAAASGVSGASGGTAAGGLQDNVAGALAYVTIIPAIVFLVVAPYNQNKFVKFHAFQCLGLGVCSIGFSIIMVVPILGWILGPLGHLAVFIAWIICIVKAYGGQKFKLPVIGDFAEKQANA